MKRLSVILFYQLLFNYSDFHVGRELSARDSLYVFFFFFFLINMGGIGRDSLYVFYFLFSSYMGGIGREGRVVGSEVVGRLNFLVLFFLFDFLFFLIFDFCVFYSYSFFHVGRWAVSCRLGGGGTVELSCSFLLV